MSSDGRRLHQHLVIHLAFGLLLASLCLLAAPSGAWAQVERDPALTVGPGECAECHKLTTAIWRNTHHYATFRDMPRNKKGIEIARKMGLRLKPQNLLVNLPLAPEA